MILRSRRTSAIAAAVLALGTLTGLAAAPASAASWTHLCVDTGIGALCARGAAPALQITVPTESSTGASTTNWLYPTTNGGQGQIEQANTGLCMQLDHAEGDSVVEAICVGDDAEQWINIYNSSYKHTVFVSYWGIVNEGRYLCLTESAQEMVAALCGSPYTQYGLGLVIGQQWGTS
jgi:hypothetical protein